MGLRLANMQQSVWMRQDIEIRLASRCLPLTPLTVLTLIFMAWITITSLTAIAPEADVWDKWSRVEKVLFMALVCYALTTNRQRIDRLIWVVVGSIGFWGVKGAVWG